MGPFSGKIGPFSKAAPTKNSFKKALACYHDTMSLCNRSSFCSNQNISTCTPIGKQTLQKKRFETIKLIPNHMGHEIEIHCLFVKVSSSKDVLTGRILIRPIGHGQF